MASSASVSSGANANNGGRSTSSNGGAAAPSSPAASKKAPAANNNSKASIIAAADREQLHAHWNYSALSLQDIHDRIRDLCFRVPTVSDSGFYKEVSGGNDEAEEADGATTTTAATTAATTTTTKELDKVEIKRWAQSLQCLLEEFNLLIGCIAPSTYVWGTDRSGAADQNLGMLSSELVRSQDQIATLVSPRLNDVLAPVVSLVTSRTVTTKNEHGEEVKQNYFETTYEDPDYVHLCHGALARNAPMMRQVVLANFDKLLEAVKDYLAAQHKDSQHDARGFVY